MASTGSHKKLSSLRLLLNRLTGFDLVRFSGQHTLRSHLHEALRRLEIDCVLDVGANEGQFGASLRSLGFLGTIHSFEPVSSAYSILSHVVATDPAWEAHQFALGSKPGTSVINVSDFTSFSSLLPVNAYAQTRWERSRVTHQEEIQIRTLDDWIHEVGLQPSSRTMLKVDTQGYDLEVLRGAQTKLPKISCILAELSLIEIYSDSPGYRESLKILEEYGFLVSGFFPITRNKNLTLNEVDCLLINTAL